MLALVREKYSGPIDERFGPTLYLQVARQSHRAPARSTVLVRESVTGAIELRYRGRLMRWTEIPARRREPAVPAETRARPSHRGHFYFVKNGDISISR